MVWPLAAFFLSGFAALLYQVIWQRLLGIFSGADVHSATVVVAAFMAGLGFGSIAGGQIADRMSRVACLRLFAGVEIAVAAFGASSSTLFYDILYRRLGDVATESALMPAILFAALLLPTFSMGMSLPLLSRGLATNIQRAASTIGWLYGVNTLGAAMGALCGTWLFLPQWGLAGSLRAAAALNLTCAVLVLPILAARRRHTVAGPAPATMLSGVAAITPHAEAALDSAHGIRFSMATCAWLFGLSGFIALSLEILWFRILGVMLKSTTFTFGTLLGVYLTGLGLGAAAGSAVAGRIRRPLLGFLILQTAAGAYAALSMSAFVRRLGKSAALTSFASYFGEDYAMDIPAAVTQLRGVFSSALEHGPNPAPAPWLFLGLYLLLPSLLIGPSTFLAGFSFPLLQRVVHTDLGHVGRRVGAVLAANILGSTLGAFVTGWALLDALGTAGTLKLMFMLSALFGVLAVRYHSIGWRATRRATAFLAGAVVLIAGVAAMPSGELLWGRLHGAEPGKLVLREDRSGLSVLRATQFDFRSVTVFVNGASQSWIPYGGIHTVLGALPAFVHEHPRSALLIGLGSGDTLFGLAGRRELERIVSIEIIGSQLSSLRDFTARRPYPGVLTLLNDPRIEQVTGDGRLYIRRMKRTYDIIQADALRPMSAHAGNLYSDQFFELLREHLNPGGLAVSWVPTERVARTFLRVFPYVWRHADIIIGSNAPIVIDRDLVGQRLNVRAVDDYFRIAGVNIEELLRPYLTGGGRTYDPSHDRSGLHDINTDLSPRDEFEIPALVDASLFRR